MKKNFLSNIIKSLKRKNSTHRSSNETVETIQVDDEKNVHPDVVEYHETLYSDRINKQYSKHSFQRKMILNNVRTVESDIDEINKEEFVKNGNIEKKVDFVLSKKKKEESKLPSHRKPANVIYVVSKPQPGQVKGDWAVRSHYKIFSHHRTKQAAIKNARTIALEKDATVLVQNMDGTFSEGFKPRKKK